MRRGAKAYASMAEAPVDEYRRLTSDVEKILMGTTPAE
jgi:hypothetical protein